MILSKNYNSGRFLSEHKVVLTIPKDQRLGIIEDGLSTIPGKLIPFSTTHPKEWFKDKDPINIFNQDVRFAGIIDSAWIDSTCPPQLIVKINIVDSDVKALIKQDKVLISYAYWRYESLLTISSFDFDYLLVFPRRVVCQ